MTCSELIIAPHVGRLALLNDSAESKDTIKILGVFHDLDYPMLSLWMPYCYIGSEWE